MALHYYKLVGYDPYWIYLDGIYPRQHIEEILQNVSFNNKRQLKNKKKFTRAESEEEHWKEITPKNIAWNSENDLTLTSTQDNIPKYLKVDSNGVIYYYYLVNAPKARAINGDKSYYQAVYAIDDYMTKWHNKLEIIRTYNPRVYANQGMLNRWDSRLTTPTGKQDKNGEEIIQYTIDYVAQKWIGQTLTDRDCTNIREPAFSTTAQELYALNFPETALPATFTCKCYNSNETIEITNFNNKLQTANSRGRYLYYACKSTAKMSANNDSLKKAHTDQQFILIPFFAGQENEIWHALNDFDVLTDSDGLLVPQGENEIGVYECEIPYSYFYGLVATNKYGAKLEYAHQPMGNNTHIDIPFFTIDNNAPLEIKIIDFAAYDRGFYGIYVNMIQNIDTWTPETEPAMFNPAFYKEVYKIGDSELVIDASYFKFVWKSNEIREFGVSGYLSFSDKIYLAYNFGENTNRALPTLDNTETMIGSISIPNFFMGSASANYFTNNATTSSTSLKNRQSEQQQSEIDVALSSAQAWIAAIPTTAIPWKAAVQGVKGGMNAAIETAKLTADMIMSNERANRTFASSINNLTSAPAQALSSANVQGVIPLKQGLFAHYAIRMHPDDRDVKFSKYTHNGYPINTMLYANDVLDNRTIMNVINFNTEHFTDDLMLLLTQHDTSFFNTKFYNQQFISWLNGKQNIYNTTFYVNCTDYKGDAYLSNIEKELPIVPIPKTFIGKYLTNFRLAYEANIDFITNAIDEDNEVPEQIHDALFDAIEIVDLQFGGYVIKCKDSQNTFYGSIIVNATCYTGYIDDDGIYHYFLDVDFLCDLEGTITCPDGTTFNTSTFNCPIKIINNSLFPITSIGNRFLSACYKFNQPLTLPNSITSIGQSFMFTCNTFNQPLTLPNELTSLGMYFMRNCSSFNQPLTLPNSLRTISEFMRSCSSFNQPLTLPNSLTTIGDNCLNEANTFNQPLTLPNSLTTIGVNFLMNTYAFNQPLTLPNGLTSVGNNFLRRCRNMISQINIQDLKASIFESGGTLTTDKKESPMYENGIEIIGTYKSEFLTKFPNLTGQYEPYRKLK